MQKCLPPFYEQINVLNALSQVVDLYKANTETEIILTCDSNIEISFDRSYLTRSVGNILKNAIQAIPEDKKGHINIRVTEDNETITISVKDNGSGMTPEHAEKIFMPYFSSKISGMGLGLPIVKNMIESGGGHINFTTAINMGTEFIITLPKTST